MLLWDCEAASGLELSVEACELSEAGLGKQAVMDSRKSVRPRRVLTGVAVAEPPCTLNQSIRMNGHIGQPT